MKQYRFLLTLLTLLAVFLLSGHAVFAVQSEVIYRGHAEKFVFIPDTTDLFGGFKGVMPGDTRQQVIALKNNTNAIIRIYLSGKAYGAEETTFLSRSTLRGKVGAVEIFNYDSPATNLTDRILLKELRPFESLEMLVELKVPDTLDNDFQSREYPLVWTFLAEEELVEAEEETVPTTTEKETPRTGESVSHLMVGTGLLVCGSMAILLLLVRKKMIR